MERDVIELAHGWDRAMVENDPVAIGSYMSDDWIIIGSDGKVSDKKSFIELVRSGALTHDVMTSEDVTVRMYGDVAVMLSRGVSGGHFRGQAFREVERASNVFVRSGGEWKCVLTHLSKLEETDY